MTALLKRTELLRAVSSQLKTLCEVNYAAFILKHIWVPVCHCMGKFAVTVVTSSTSAGKAPSCSRYPSDAFKIVTRFLGLIPSFLIKGVSVIFYLLRR